MRLRSLLFAPGDSARKSDKAIASAADAVILDLEDAVAPSAKEAARQAVAERLAATARPGLMVRVNARSTAWYLADLAALVRHRPAALVLPKCQSLSDLRAFDHHLEAFETAAGLPVGAIPVIPLVTESAAALAALDYRGAPSRLLALGFAAEDLAADLGVEGRRPDGGFAAPVALARAAVLVAAAVAAVAAIDTPFPDPRNPEGLVLEAAAAAADGFAGKLCIHPDQLAPVAAAFTPAAARIRWAEQVRAAFAANPGAGVLTLEGRMIEPPHLKLAERILAAAS